MTKRMPSLLLSTLLLYVSIPGVLALHSPLQGRRDFLAAATAASGSSRAAVPLLTWVAAGCSSLLQPPQSVLAFEGGVGGLGKTKPQTGVLFRDGSAPLQNKQGIVSAELLTGKDNSVPIIVQFQAPYPLLASSSGLEARDLQQSESAFVQVIDGVPRSATTTATSAGKALLFKALETEIFGSKGKFGAYGAPVDIKLSKVPDDNNDHLYKASFTTYTPAMRESERKVLLSCQYCADDTVVVLVTGTTAARFKSQEEVLKRIAQSFLAVDAPKTALSSR